MSSTWLRLPERGSTWSIRLIVWIALCIGRPVARLLLVPISGYFLLTVSPEVRRASREFLRRATGRPAGWPQLARHLYSYAQVLLDRVFFLSDRFAHFDLRVHGGEQVLERVAAGQGLLLMSAHLGSFEALRGVSRRGPDLPLRVLMNVGHNEKMTTVLAAVNPALAEAVIPIGDPASLLKVKEYLDRGYVIGVLADRVATSENSKWVRCQFLGAPAEFPAGPLLLAAALRCPVLLGFGLLRAGCSPTRYDVYFEPFAERIELARGRRLEDVQLWAQRYADRLGYYARAAPYNWFNFYDYWAVPGERRD